VQSGKGQDLKLDSEGGAEAQTPKIRYLQVAIAVGPRRLHPETMAEPGGKAAQGLQTG
jgi:hypothetical protein